MFLVERASSVAGKGNAVYSFKERTNVGLLSAAAIANGWVALEECRSEKYISEESEESYSGRSDLRIWRDRRYHEIEAKFTRIALTSSKTVRFEKAYEKAVKDSLRSTSLGHRSEKRIGLTFVVPTLTNSQITSLTQAEKDLLLKGLVTYIDREFSPHLLAYSFPGESPASGASHRVALGVILVGAMT